MQFIFITNHPDLARHAQDAGVDRIMVDLEYIGKIERQGHLDTLISRHTMADVASIRACLTGSELMVRVNPIHAGSAEEISAVISSGADRIMLPMFKTAHEVKDFFDFVGGRAKTCLLLETAQALVRIDEILSLPCLEEIHIGLNDLHLALGLDFMFELLSGGIVEYAARKIKARSIPFGFGGISRLGTGSLDAGLILSEHVRLGSQLAILSRSFHGQTNTLDEFRSTLDLKVELERVRYHLSNLEKASTLELHETQLLVIELVQKLVTAPRARTSN